MRLQTCLFAVTLFTLVGSAPAQTPGIGDTRPSGPATRDAPADGAIKGGSIERRGSPADAEKSQVDTDRSLHRCYELSGSLRDDCLRQERNAGAGASHPAEPATAPPPQNPR